ncbi:MAG: methionine--tRNA ligase [Candidatus Nealsonbacteria bacterium]|nr:methionine--tRNA ligase [Candidatus Nealsonbacteria bacterium]
MPLLIWGMLYKKKENLPVKELVDKNAGKFYELKKILDLSYDDFIRTTEIRHIQVVQNLWKACQKDIEKKIYRGLYCVGCEEFYKENELENGLCPEHKTKPELVEEENYFFKLSNYQKKLKKIFDSNEIEIIPGTRRNEVLSFIKSGLEDICISRSAKRAQGWGIDVPGDSSQKIWVWFDALANYLNSQYWPADVHIIGKGILRFHAVYWPAMLLSARLLLPKKIFVHGYLTIGGQKMSKSLGNVIDPFELVKKYGTDAVRYFLLREIPSTEDGDFTEEKFVERYNADLAGGIGNLVARVVTLATKSKIQNQKSKINPKLKIQIKKTQNSYTKALEEFKFNETLIAVWELISFCDEYIEKEKPWEGGKNDVIGDLLLTINEMAKLLKPFLPETSERIIKQENKPLFPRLS